LALIRKRELLVTLSYVPDFTAKKKFPQNAIFQLKCPVHIIHQNHDLKAADLYDYQLVDSLN
jgi:hypothetical protein